MVKLLICQLGKNPGVGTPLFSHNFNQASKQDELGFEKVPLKVSTILRSDDHVAENAGSKKRRSPELLGQP
jgi:hypothetical protein